MDRRARTTTSKARGKTRGQDPPQPDPFSEAKENTALLALRGLFTARRLMAMAAAILGGLAVWLGIPRIGPIWAALGQFGQIAVGFVLLVIAGFFAMVFKQAVDARRRDDAFRAKAERERAEGAFEYVGIGQVWDTITAPIRGPKRDARRVEARSLNLIGTPGQQTSEPIVTSLHPWTIQLHTLFGQAWTSALEVLGPEEQARVQMALAKMREVRMREFGNKVVARHILVGVGSGTTAVRNFYLNAPELAETGDATFIWLTHPLLTPSPPPQASVAVPLLAAGKDG